MDDSSVCGQNNTIPPRTLRADSPAAITCVRFGQTPPRTVGSEAVLVTTVGKRGSHHDKVISAQTLPALVRRLPSFSNRDPL